MALLSGDSGVGKTRLVREFERRATDGGALVLRGEAVEEADGELPYAPLIGALRPLVRARHPALDALGRGSRAQLAALLPGLDEEAGASDVNDPSAQVRLFEALLELLDVLSEERPVSSSSRTCTGPIARRGRSSTSSRAACATSGWCCC